MKNVLCPWRSYIWTNATYSTIHNAGKILQCEHIKSFWYTVYMRILQLYPLEYWTSWREALKPFGVYGGIKIHLKGLLKRVRDGWGLQMSLLELCSNPHLF